MSPTVTEEIEDLLIALQDEQPVAAEQIFTGMKLLAPRLRTCGFGEVVGEPDPSGYVQLAYFVSPVDKECRRLKVSDLSYPLLPSQTRCFLQSGGATTYGRVLVSDMAASVPRSYRVKFAGNPIPVSLREDEFSVRAYVRSPDPVEVLATLTHETPFFFEGRRRLLSEILHQEALCQGLPGVASSKLLLFGHQLEIARRVLQDPRIRYLLADEVGLGKTIEAGMILRQIKLDQPSLRAAVFVPDTLVAQWKQELRDRYSLGDTPVFPHGELAAATADHAVDLVIIDEAHRIVDGGRARLYEPACRLTRTCRHVLLLTATPALRSSGELLSLLHLLEPGIYRLEDQSEFELRFNRRKEIGAVLQAIASAGLPPLFRRLCRRICELLPHDERLRQLVEEGLGAEPLDVESLRTRLVSLVSETYRIHRRMLRTRRSWLIAQDPQFARTVRPRVESDLREEDGNELWALLEAWRTSLAGNRSRSDAPLDMRLADAYFELASSIAADSDELCCRIRSILKTVRPGPSSDGRQLLKDMLEVATRRARRDPRKELLLELLRQQAGHGKCVVFCSSTGTCGKLVDAARECLGEKAVAFVGRGQSQEESAQALQLFRRDGECSILVCDDAGEEGVNLQFASQLIFYDLPLNPMRIEQRIGRLDRIGRQGVISCHVCLSSEENELALDGAWWRILDSALGILQTSVSDIPFLLDHAMTEFRRMIFDGGPLAVGSLVPELINRIRATREENEQQDIVDSVHTPKTARDALAASFAEADANSQTFADALCRYLDGHLGLTCVRMEGRDAFVFKRTPNRDLLVPTDRIVPVARHFVRPSSVSRTAVCDDFSLEFLRPGHAALEVCRNLLSWDERGRAYAMWRVLPSSQDVRVAFRLTLTVGPDIAALDKSGMAASASLSTEALARRMNEWLCPYFVDVVVLPDGTRAPDDIDSLCRQEYDRRYDRNLGGPRVGIPLGVFGLENWGNMCRTVSETVLGKVKEGPRLRGAVDDALQKATRYFDEAADRLQAQAASRLLSKDEIRCEQATQQAARDGVSAAISSPRVSLDTIGAYLLSATCPAECDADE